MKVLWMKYGWTNLKVDEERESLKNADDLLQKAVQKTKLCGMFHSDASLVGGNEYEEKNISYLVISCTYCQHGMRLWK